jgi:hypothetical protein
MTVLVAVPSFPQRRGTPQTYKGLVQRAGFLHNVPAGTYLQVFPYRENYACQLVPVGMYLQADKPLFPHLLSTLPEEPFAGHEAGLHKKEEKRGY